ncbi:MAG: hypothetical protein FWE50_02535 [Alphaproteobacteria bacterium]|nr:hypothetical protein [Alphaproteobacteria bacterium]
MSYKTPCSPVLFWPKSRARDTDPYQSARRTIADQHGEMPRVESGDFDMAEFFKANSDAVLYYPVFSNSCGWWGELLGGSAKICEKISVSKDCQLMVIVGDKKQEASDKKTQLFAAEIYPTNQFFKKVAAVGVTVSDMLATESGTILALFSGKNQSKFQNFIESTGNFYLGCVGHC